MTPYPFHGLRCISCDFEEENVAKPMAYAVNHLAECPGRDPYRFVPAWSYWWHQGYEIAWKAHGNLADTVPDVVAGCDAKRWYSFSPVASSRIIRRAFAAERNP